MTDAIVKAETERMDRLARLAVEAYQVDPTEWAAELEADEVDATWDGIDATWADGAELPFPSRLTVRLANMGHADSTRLMLRDNARFLAAKVGPVAARAYAECFGLPIEDI